MENEWQDVTEEMSITFSFFLIKFHLHNGTFKLLKQQSIEIRNKK